MAVSDMVSQDTVARKTLPPLVKLEVLEDLDGQRSRSLLARCKGKKPLYIMCNWFSRHPSCIQSTLLAKAKNTLFKLLKPAWTCHAEAIIRDSCRVPSPLPFLRLAQPGCNSRGYSAGTPVVHDARAPRNRRDRDHRDFAWRKDAGRPACGRKTRRRMEGSTLIRFCVGRVGRGILLHGSRFSQNLRFTARGSRRSGGRRHTAHPGLSLAFDTLFDNPRAPTSSVSAKSVGRLDRAF